jgi:RNA polymerase sigma factor for flagellar operon FliA
MYLQDIHISDTRSTLEMGMWYRFYTHKNEKSRSELVEFYMPMVKRLATYIYYKRATNEVDYDDYYHFGIVGLLESIDRYQMDGRAIFSTYATYRIKGAIYSGLAKLTEKRAQTDCRSKLMHDRIESLQNTTDRPEAFEEIVNLTIGLALGYLIQGSYLTDKQSYFAENHPYKHNELDGLKRHIGKLIDVLPEKENIVVTYHYFKNVSFDNIADILELSNGRVSQLHKSALARIRRALKSDNELNFLY